MAVVHTNDFPSPLELVYRIIDHLWNDRSSLRACSLVCSSWRSEAQFHIFRSLKISKRGISNEWVYATLVEDIGRFFVQIRELYLNRLSINIVQLEAMTSKMPRLRCLQLHEIHVESDNEETYSFTSACPSLQELTVDTCFFFNNFIPLKAVYPPMMLNPLFSLFPNVRTCRFHCCPIPLRSIQSSCLPANLTLEHLETCDSNPILGGTLLEQLPQTASKDTLRNLDLGSLSEFYQYMLLQNLPLSMRSNIRYLRLGFDHCRLKPMSDDEDDDENSDEDDDEDSDEDAYEDNDEDADENNDEIPRRSSLTLFAPELK